MRSRGPKNSQGKVSVNSHDFGTRGQVRSPACRLGNTVRGDLSKPRQTNKYASAQTKERHEEDPNRGG